MDSLRGIVERLQEYIYPPEAPPEPDWKQKVQVVKGGYDASESVEASKLMEWLLQRRYIQNNWSVQLEKVKSSLTAALAEHPPPSPLPINDWTIIESESHFNSLLATDNTEKTFLGNYQSPPLHAWDQVVRNYATGNCHIAQLSQICQQILLDKTGNTRKLDKAQKRAKEDQQRLVQLEKNETEWLSKKGKWMKQYQVESIESISLQLLDDWLAVRMQSHFFQPLAKLLTSTQFRALVASYESVKQKSAPGLFQESEFMLSTLVNSLPEPWTLTTTERYRLFTDILELEAFLKSQQNNQLEGIQPILQLFQQSQPLFQFQAVQAMRQWNEIGDALKKIAKQLEKQREHIEAGRNEIAGLVASRQGVSDKMAYFQKRLEVDLTRLAHHPVTIAWY